MRPELCWSRRPVASLAPADDDRPSGTGQRQGRRFRLDRIACRARETPPGLDRHRPLRRVATSRRARPRRGGRPARRAEVQSSRRRSASGTRSSRSSPEEVGVAAREEPCGRRGPAAARKVGSSRARIHASPIGVRTGVSDRRSASNAADASPRADPRPPANALGRRGTEDVQVPTRELEASVARVDLGRRHGPDGRLSRAVPPDQDRAGRCGVPERSWGGHRARRPASP